MHVNVAVGAGAAAAAAVLVSLLAALTGTYRFRVVREGAELRGLRTPLRVAFLADLHFGSIMRRGSVRRWVDATLRLRPDLILLGGDLIDHGAEHDLRPLLRELARLRAPLGVYAVWGNHDRSVLRKPESPLDLEGFARALRDEAGVKVLRNTACRVRDDLHVAGIDDLHAGRPDLGAALAGTPAAGTGTKRGGAGSELERPATGPVTDQPTAGRTTDRPAAATVLLSHNPDVLPHVPTAVCLTLCGHTHGGQVCLPWYGPLRVDSAYGRRFAEGWVRAPALGYVSRGLGVTVAPLRFACPAEITLLELTPAGRARAGAAEGAFGARRGSDRA